MKKLFIVSLVIFLLASALLSGAEAIARTYTTNFPLTENPISAGGNWINGGTTGINWTNVRTTPGLAFGTPMSGYADDTAIVTGSWGATQTIQGTVYKINPVVSYQEVELRLRTSISANSITGYEINFRCSKNSDAYTEIVRWNGPLGNFTYLSRQTGSQYGVQTGDVVKTTISGSTINVYINNVLVNTATDSTYSTGSPGIGFCCGTSMSDFGFTSFTASDGTDTLPPSPPKNLHTLP